MSTRSRGRIRSSGGVCARRLRRVAVALTAPWSLAAFACVVVLGRDGRRDRRRPPELLILVGCVDGVRLRDLGVGLKP